MPHGQKKQKNKKKKEEEGRLGVVGATADRVTCGEPITPTLHASNCCRLQGYVQAHHLPSPSPGWEAGGIAVLLSVPRGLHLSLLVSSPLSLSLHSPPGILVFLFFSPSSTSHKHRRWSAPGLPVYRGEDDEEGQFTAGC